MEIKLVVSQFLIAISPIVAIAIVGTSSQLLLLGAVATLFLCASWYNKRIAIDFFNIGEQVGLLKQQERLVVLNPKTGKEIENVTILVYDHDSDKLIDQAIITFDEEPPHQE
jgi:hypothetical protein